MATLSPPQDLAAEIVRILVEDGARVGTGTTLQSLRQKFGPLRSQDFETGFRHALASDWVLVNNLFVTLTQAGFDAA